MIQEIIAKKQVSFCHNVQRLTLQWQENERKAKHAAVERKRQLRKATAAMLHQREQLEKLLTAAGCQKFVCVL